MSNHVHHIVASKQSGELANIICDLKKYTSKQIVEAIKQNPKESRKNWMLWIFESVGSKNSKNTAYQFWRQDNHPFTVCERQRVLRGVGYRMALVDHKPGHRSYFS